MKRSRKWGGAEAKYSFVYMVDNSRRCSARRFLNYIWIMENPESDIPCVLKTLAGWGSPMRQAFLFFGGGKRSRSICF